MTSNLDRYIERSTQLGGEIQSLKRKGGRAESKHGHKIWQPPFAVYHHQEHLFIDVELPGLSADSLTVESRPDMVAVRGEKPDLARLQDREEIASTRQFGPFASQFAIPAGYALDSLEQRLDNGVLHLKVRVVPRKALQDGR